jgi:hypothetical protein
VVFRSPEVFRYFQFGRIERRGLVADHFQILPFLRALQDQGKYFYILA